VAMISTWRLVSVVHEETETYAVSGVVIIRSMSRSLRPNRRIPRRRLRVTPLLTMQFQKPRFPGGGADLTIRGPYADAARIQFFDPRDFFNAVVYDISRDIAGEESGRAFLIGIGGTG